MKYKIIFDVKQENGTSMKYTVLSVRHYKNGTISSVMQSYNDDVYFYKCNSLVEGEEIKKYIINRTINLKGFHNIYLDSISIIPINS